MHSQVKTRYMSMLIVSLFAFCQTTLAGIELGKSMFECYMFSNDRMIYSHAKDQGFEFSSCYVAVPVCGVAANAKITPVFTPGTLEGITDLKVWTDKQMVDYYLADWNKGLGDSWWEDEGSSDSTLWYDTARCSYEIEGGIWDDAEIRSRNVVPRPDRRWILFKGKIPKGDWGGMKTFTIGIKGTGVSREYATLMAVNGNNVPGLHPTDFFNRVTLTGCDTKYDFDLEGFNTAERNQGYAGCEIWVGESDFNSLRVNVPESGTLVLRRGERYAAELVEVGSSVVSQAKAYPQSEHECIVKFGGSSEEERWRFNGKTSLRAEFGGLGFTQLLFFPANARSVAVVSLQADYDMRHDVSLLRGYVKGSGTFKAGETVKLTAVSGGALFKGWEVVYGELPPSVDLTKQVLSFVVPESMCGTETEMKQVTVRAVWIDKADDRATVSVSVADEYAPKAAIEPIAVDVSGCTSLPTVKVKGLPPGLKFTAKALDVKATKAAPAAHYAANTVYGTPTKSGVYATTFTVTTAGKRTATTNVTFTVIDRTAGESFLKVACDAEMGKATGAGIYPAGKKVTLKATPQKGFVFAGWCAEDGEPLAGDVDYRSPSFPFVATGADTTVRARFARAEEDAALELLVDEVYNTSGAFDLPLSVNSLSLPKVTLSGLPAGLKFDAKGLRISGTATKPGSYTVTAKLTNATVKKAIAKTFRIVVDNLTGANGLLAVTDAAGGAGSLMNGRGERYVMSVGVAEHGLPVLNAADAGDKVTLAGLPTGLRYDAKTGKVTGVATKAGMYTVRATVKSGKSSHVSTFTVEVAPLPSWAVGTFAGCGEGEIPGYDLAEDNLYGTVTVAANGKVSGRFLFDTGDERLLTSAFSAPALTGHDAEGGCYFLDVTLAFRDGKTVVESRECRLRIERNGGDAGIGGGMIDVGGVDVTLYQNVWKVKGFEGLPVFAERRTVVSKTMEIHGVVGVYGTSTLTLTIDPKGGVAATFIEEGVEFGEPFRERTVFKGDLIVTRRGTDGGMDCYVAVIPFVVGNFAVMEADVTMRVSPDGKVYADGCEITDCTDLGDWGSR